MKYLIVSNNPLVKEEFEHCLLIEGSVLDVLIKVRDLVYNGMKLASHPLGASVRMLYSPYRSVVVEKEKDKGDNFYAEVIENSIISYKKHTVMRNVDEKNSRSYALMDKELLYSAFENLKINEFV